MPNTEENRSSIENFSSQSYESLSELISTWIDIPQSVQNLFNITIFNNAIIDWIVAVLVFFIVFLFRSRLIKISEKILTRISQTFETPLGDDFFKVIHKPLKWKILLIGLNISYAILSFSKSSEDSYQVINHSLNILLLTWFLILMIDFLHKSYKHYSKQNSIDMKDTFIKLSVTISKVVIVIIMSVILLQIWGYNIGALLASLGLVGMAIALAAKDSARHLFGSIMIFTDAPFKVGDWIKTPDVEGTIEEIGMRSTKVRTFAQALVAVPNGNLADSAILNWSQMGKRRIKLTLGLTYATNSTQMQSILDDIREFLKNDEDIHQDTIHIYFNDLGDSSLGIFCYFFTKTTSWGDYMRVKERVYLELMKIVENNNSSFAFPSQSLYIQENKTNI